MTFDEPDEERRIYVVEIPLNTYRVESDPEVERVVGLVADRLKTCEDVTIYRHGMNETSGVYADKHVAEAAGRMFAKAGYFASMYMNEGGYFGWLRISRKPQDNSYRCEELREVMR